MKLMKLLFLSAFMIFATSAIAHNAAPLTVTTEYEFVGHLGIFDDESRLLVWRGTTSGDIEGVILYWAGLPGPLTGQVSHYDGGGWEIWDANETILILAGEEAGSTTDRPGKNGVWRANGIVTYVNPDFPELYDLFGRRMHEGGEFIWAIPGVLPSHGWGRFRIN